MYALVTEVKHICFTDVIASQKSLYSHCVINLLKRKNHFLQEDSQQAQEDIDLYKQLRTISRDDFKKDEENISKRNQSV